MKRILLLMSMAFCLQFCTYSQTSTKTAIDSTNKKPLAMNKENIPLTSADTTNVIKTDAEWKKILSPEVYHVAREKGTERAWSSPLESIKDKGTYYCAVCGNGLFVSDTKFESGCGWPSFYQPVSKTSIIYAPDNSYGMKRTEVMCGKCKSHLGHVFDDGPPPTGLRYCINGVVLDFKKAQEAEKNYNKGE